MRKKTMRSAYSDRMSSIITTDVLLAVASAFLGAFVFAVSVPVDLWAANDKDVSLSIGAILWFGAIIVGLALALSAVLATILAAISPMAQRAISLVLFVLATSAFINATFLVGDYGEVDGRGALDIEAFGVLTFIQFGVLAALAAAAYAYWDRTSTLLQAVLAVGFIPVIFSATAIATTDRELVFKTPRVPANETSVYSKTSPNVIFLVLDELQKEIFEHQVSDELRADLDGFTWYTDTLSNYPTTIVALMALLSGEIYTNDISISEFEAGLQEERRSLPFLFADAGFDVRKTTSWKIVDTLFPPQSVRTIDIPSAISSQVLALYDLSIFRMVPETLKLYVYNDENWLMSRLVGYFDPYLRTGNNGLSYKQLRKFVEQRVVAQDGAAPTFRYHHSILTHSPIWFDSACQPLGAAARPPSIEMAADEIRCAMMLLGKLINSLKQAGVYDNTMIVITSDHGSFYEPPAFEKTEFPYKRASSVILIKPLSRRGMLEENSSPVLNTDLPKTVANAVGVENMFNGYDIIADPIPGDRERKFYFYHWRRELWNKTFLPAIKKFSISGPSNKPSSWRTELSPQPCDETIDFGEKRTISSVGGVGLSPIRPKGRWSVGPTATIRLQPEAGCTPRQLLMSVGAYLPKPDIEHRAKVFVNDIEVAEIKLSRGQPKLELRYDIPAKRNYSRESFEVRFEIENPISPFSVGTSKDTREFGLRFHDARLVSG